MVGFRIKFLAFWPWGNFLKVVYNDAKKQKLFPVCITIKIMRKFPLDFLQSQGPELAVHHLAGFYKGPVAFGDLPGAVQ
jgi:hypothetical protein